MKKFRNAGFRTDNVIGRMLKNRPDMCSKCMERLFYIGYGKYRCAVCNGEYPDDFGKVMEYIEKHEECTVKDISRVTLVDEDVVEALLEDDFIEGVNWDKYFLECSKCGCAISSGRFCQWCQRSMLGSMCENIYQEAKKKAMLERSKTNEKLEGKIKLIRKLD